MITIEHAHALRRMIERLAETLSDTDAVNGIELFPVWEADTEYIVGDRRRDDGVLYKCLISHKSQSTWHPKDSPSLWVRIDDPSQEFPEWIQPTGSTDAYMKGDKVSHSDKHWISDVDGNVWEPGVYGWTEAQ